MRNSGLLAAVMLAGCVTRSQVEHLPHDAGLKAVYKADLAKTRMAVSDAFGEMGFKPKKEPQYAGKITRLLYGHGVTATSAGRYARAIIEDGSGECSVWIVVESKIDNADTDAQDSAAAQDLHDLIEKRLK